MRADCDTAIPLKELRTLLGDLVTGMPNPVLGALISPQLRPRQFVRVIYEPGGVIMPRGIYGDYAALLVHGRVEAYKADAVFDTEQRSLQPCWRRPGRLRRWFEDFVLDHTDRPTRSRARFGEAAVDPKARPPSRWTVSFAQFLRRLFRGYFDRLRFGTDPLEVQFQRTDVSFVAEKELWTPEGGIKGASNRLMGVTAAMWNLRRSMTLVARTDPRDLDEKAQPHPCEVLLIHRRALLDMNQHVAAFRDSRSQQFLDRKLAGLLRDNRLFRDKLYIEDVASFSHLVRQLQGRERSTETTRLREMLGKEFRNWIASLDTDRLAEHDQQRIVSQLNDLLTEVLAEEPQPLPQNERVRANRKLLEAMLSGSLRASAEFRPVKPEEFAPFVQFLREHGLSHKELLHFRKGECLYHEGQPADGLYLLISGKVRVTRPLAGQELLVNQLEQHGFLGVSCVEPGATHSANAEAITEVDAVRLPTALVASLQGSSHSCIFEKLTRERDRQKKRVKQWADARVPVDPPEQIASRLLVAHNLLLIDMDHCTRCDQCVRACAEAHEGISRFRRPNPELRFNNWEVTRACLHCSDAPCQKACPVGAIAFYRDDLVQIHRSRCIGCTYCMVACPFDAIEMLPPLSLDDAGRAKEGKGFPIANKCDLCLDMAHEPPCVHSCPYDAAHRGPVRKLFPAIKTWEGDRYAQD